MDAAAEAGAHSGAPRAEEAAPGSAQTRSPEDAGGAPASPAGARAPSMLERWGAAVSASSTLPTDISRGSHAAAALHKVRCTGRALY